MRIKYLNLVMFVCLLGLLLLSVSFAQSAEPYADETLEVEGPQDIIPVGQFKAIGPTEPVKLPAYTKGAVEVYFENQPTSLRFNMPAYPCMVTENNIQYVTFGTETYDPRIGRKSFEPQQDRDNTYNRFWIESENEARIIVRFRGALCNREDKIAHTDIPSGSPYGKGDWVDEWYYIYPDGTHTRHAKIYTGLTQQSLPFGYNRRPPNVIYEFMEAAVWGQPGRLPTDDVETEALTLVRLVGAYSENMLHEGESKTISFKLYPKDFGDFRDAHIMVINLKSQYKPFVIASPFGARAQPYVVDWKVKGTFVAWDMEDYGQPPEDFFITELGHLINYSHYRRTDNTLEQVYLQGMTNAKDPVKDVVPLAWSWIAPPRLEMEDLEPSYDTIYNPAQRAYIVPRKGQGPVKLEFELDDYSYEAPLRIVNPAFVIKDWGESDVVVKVDGKRVEHGKDYKAGYEETHTGIDLILWFKMKSTKALRFVISPSLN
ncbi:MAG: hypothetical protein ACYS0I_07170 [Planctomycetota bacterium]|jgi:hypothetical protein